MREQLVDGRRPDCVILFIFQKKLIVLLSKKGFTLGFAHTIVQVVSVVSKMKQKREPEAVLGTKPATKKAKKTPAKADMKIQAKTKKNNEIDDIFGSATAGKTVKKGEDDALLKDIAEKVAAARKSNADTKVRVGAMLHGSNMGTTN